MKQRTKDLIMQESICETYKPNLEVVGDKLSKYNLQDKGLFCGR